MATNYFDFNIDTAPRDELVGYINSLQNTLTKMAEEKDDAGTNEAYLAIENARLRRQQSKPCPHCCCTMTPSRGGWYRCGYCGGDFNPYTGEIIGPWFVTDDERRKLADLRYR